MIRQALGVLGILLAVIGLAFDVAPVRWAAIGILLAVVGWRIAERNLLRRNVAERPDSESERRDT